MSNQPMAKHVILGAGQLGLTIMEQLAGKGQAVTLVNRSGKVNEPLPAGVNLVAGDVTKADVIAGLCQNAAIVFFAPSRPIINGRNSGHP